MAVELGLHPRLVGVGGESEDLRPRLPRISDTLCSAARGGRHHVQAAPAAATHPGRRTDERRYGYACRGRRLGVVVVEDRRVSAVAVVTGKEAYPLVTPGVGVVQSQAPISSSPRTVPATRVAVVAVGRGGVTTPSWARLIRAGARHLGPASRTRVATDRTRGADAGFMDRSRRAVTLRPPPPPPPPPSSPPPRTSTGPRARALRRPGHRSPGADHPLPRGRTWPSTR